MTASDEWRKVSGVGPTDCTLCNFMRRTEPLAKCPRHKEE